MEEFTYQKQLLSIQQAMMLADIDKRLLACQREIIGTDGDHKAALLHELSLLKKDRETTVQLHRTQNAIIDFDSTIAL